MDNEIYEDVDIYEKVVELSKLSTYDKLIKRAIGSIVGYLSLNTIAHSASKYIEYETVLSAATAEDISYDFFAVEGYALADANDAPVQGNEYNYLVLTFEDSTSESNTNRRIVLAFTFTGSNETVDMFYRHIWKDEWVQDNWVKLIDSSVQMENGELLLSDGAAKLGANESLITMNTYKNPSDKLKNYRSLTLYNENVGSELGFNDVANCLQLIVKDETMEDGTWDNYTIFHEGNLPPALRTDENGLAYVVANDVESSEVKTLAVYHEGNPPDPDAVGAAPSIHHNIRTYTSLDQLGLSNDDMTTDTFLANIKAINTALGDGDVILYLTTTNEDNLHHSIVNKLNTDLGKTLDGASINNISVKISRTGNIYNAITTDVVYNSSEEAMYVYSCIYNKEAEEANDELTNFVITTHPDGFLPLIGGNITGNLTINNVNAATEAYVNTKTDELNTKVNGEIATKITALDNKINNEISSEIAALDDKITNDIGNRISSLENELSGSVSNDIANLDTKIDNLDSELTKNISDLDTKLTNNISTSISTHNTASDAHNDIRLLISEVLTQLENFLDVDDTTRDQLSEVLALIDENADSIEAITSSKVNVNDIINNLTTNVSNKPLSAAQGVALKGLIDALTNVVNGKSDSNHTHNYAGSSSAGGSATSAVKLATARDLYVELGSTDTVSFDGTKSVTLGVNGVLPVTNGGTGVYQMPKIYVDLNSTTTAVDLFQNIVTPGVSGTLSIEHGGTGATTASAARTALDITPVNINAADRAHSHAVSDVEGLQEVIEELAPSQLLKIIDLPLMTASEGQTNFTIEMEDFDINYDSIQVQKGNLLLFPTQYNVSGNTLTLSEGVESGVTIGIRVYRTIEVENRGDSSEPGQSGSTSVILGTNLPYAAGTASAGIATTVSRSDHVHPAQTTISGNAGSATKLATARTILTNLASTTTASFDGSDNVTPGVTGVLAISNGGTGATDASTARTNLGIDDTWLNSNHNHRNTSINPSTIELTGGSSTNGGYIDFHFNKNSNDYTSRIIEDSEGVLNLISSKGIKFNSGALSIENGGTGATTAEGAREALGINADISELEEKVNFNTTTIDEIFSTSINLTSNIGSINNRVTTLENARTAYKPFHVGSSAPTDKKILWIDTTANTGGLKYHNGSAWVVVPVSYS